MDAEWRRTRLPPRVRAALLAWALAEKVCLCPGDGTGDPQNSAATLEGGIAPSCIPARDAPERGVQHSSKTLKSTLKHF